MHPPTHYLEFSPNVLLTSTIPREPGGDEGCAGPHSPEVSLFVCLAECNAPQLQARPSEETGITISDITEHTTDRYCMHSNMRNLLLRSDILFKFSVCQVYWWVSLVNPGSAGQSLDGRQETPEPRSCLCLHSLRVTVLPVLYNSPYISRPT